MTIYAKLTRWTLFGALAVLAILALVVKLAHIIRDHIRFLYTINLDDGQQQYWTEDTSQWSRLKKHLFTAPLFHKRHNREIQLSSAVSAGTIPSRLHTIFLSFYFLTNVVYCCMLDYQQPVAALRAEIRGRTGHMVVINMMPLFLFATRNNPFIQILGISFDTFNLIHRWLGRIVVIEALAHVFIWGINKHAALGLSGIREALQTDNFVQYGFISSIALTLILFQSPSAIRHAFYETFLHLHQFLAATMFVGVLLHVESQALPQKPYMFVIIGIWGLERATRIIRLVYYNVSRHGVTKVHIEALEGGACRATFEICRSWTTTPGCHIFAYIPSVALHMSHPFSIAWHESYTHSQLSRCPTLMNMSEKTQVEIVTPVTINSPEEDFQPLPQRKGAAISCIMSTRTGMTASLYNRAKASPGGLTLTAFVEGPYGGVQSLKSYGTVLLFAGGVGITHQLSHLQNLLATRVCSTRKITLVWSVRTLAQLSWARMWLEELASTPHPRIKLEFQFYVSKWDKERGNEMMCGRKIGRGRADVRGIVEREVSERVGAMTVGVCGPGAFADDVRAATRECMDGTNVDFWEEVRLPSSSCDYDPLPLVQTLTYSARHLLGE